MSTRERNLLIALGVIVLGAAAFFLFTTLGGEEPEEQAAPTPTASPPPVPAAPGTGVEEPQPQEPPRAVTFFGGRDPFVPLVVAEAAAGGIETAEAEPAPGGEEPTTGGELPAGEAPVEPVTEGAEEAEQPGVTVTGRQVTLIDIVDDDTAQVSVEGETFTVDEGQDFEENFELVSVSGNCARLLFGDESFTLCQGAAPK
jgi:hypothetical protein